MVKKKQKDQDTHDQPINDEIRDNGAGADGACENDDNANMSGFGHDAGDNSAGATATATPSENDPDFWRDKYLRLSAEFDNFRKRTLREKMEIESMGGRRVIEDILPVLDDIDRALDAARTVDDVDSVRMGTELIAHKLRHVLEGKGLKEIIAVGEHLDTDFHDAVAKTPVENCEHKGRIVDVVQKGYTLKDNVIRHAKVVVGE